MTGFGTGPLPVRSAIYVSNLPPGTDEVLLAEHFGQIGLIKKDKRTNRPKIWIYRDKATNEPKGDATVTYEDPHAASAAVDWFNNTEFRGSVICVSIAESKNKESAEPPPPPPVEEAPADVDAEEDPSGEAGLAGKGRGRGEPGAKAAWQQEGDWPCPNPSCSNINFAFRGVCNRCGSARPSGGSGGGGGAGGGRGRGRGAVAGVEGAGRGARGPGGPPGLFGPNDWNCPMCGNINWAKRTKCNICNTTKPGHNEGGAREGRAGGYKEFDEAEIEETRRRRKELEEDDGEMYDEFGNLKKKFRVKAKQGEAHVQQAVSGVGKAGWDVEEFGVAESGRMKERSKDRNDKDADWGRERSRERSGDYEDGRNGHRSYKDGDSDNDMEKDGSRDRERPKDRDRSWHETERGRDVDRDDYRERERSRDRDRGRTSDRDKRDRYRDLDRARDRGTYRGRGLESDGGRDRLRVRDRLD